MFDVDLRKGEINYVRLPNFIAIGTEVSKIVIKHFPKILAGMGITGYFVAVVDAVKATPEAYKAVQDAECETPIEYIKVGGKYYIKPAAEMIFSTACVLGSVTLLLKENASLAASAMMYKELCDARHEKSEEILGKKKTAEIEDAADIELAEPKGPISEEGVIQTGYGNTLFYESLTGRYFRCSVDRVNSSRDHMNTLLMNEMSATADDWFDYLNIPKTQISYSAIWDVSNGFLDLRKPCGKFPTGSNPNGNEPCFVVSLTPGPTSKYDDLYTYRNF